MSLPPQNLNEKNSMESHECRQRRGMIILIMMAVIFLAFGVFALMQRNAAIQLASTAQAASTSAIAQQTIAEVNVREEQVQAQTAQANADVAQARMKISRANELAAQSFAMRDKDFVVSMLLGLEAHREYKTPRSIGAVLDNARAYPQIQGYMHGHDKFVTVATFSPDGTMLASAGCLYAGTGCDGQILLHDLRSNLPVKSLLKHTELVASLAFSPDGSRLASTSMDRFIILWDVKTGQPIGDPIPDVGGYSVTFSPDGNLLASGGCSQFGATNCSKGNVKLWDGKTGQPDGF